MAKLGMVRFIFDYTSVFDAPDCIEVYDWDVWEDGFRIGEHGYDGSISTVISEEGMAEFLYENLSNSYPSRLPEIPLSLDVGMYELVAEYHGESEVSHTMDGTEYDYNHYLSDAKIQLINPELADQLRNDYEYDKENEDDEEEEEFEEDEEEEVGEDELEDPLGDNTEGSTTNSFIHYRHSDRNTSLHYDSGRTVIR